MGLRDLANAYTEGLGVQNFGPDWRVKRQQALAAVKHTEAETSQAQAGTEHMQVETQQAQYNLEKAKKDEEELTAALVKAGYPNDQALKAAQEITKQKLTEAQISEAQAGTKHTEALTGAVPSEVTLRLAEAAHARAGAGYQSELTNQLRNASAGGIEQIPGLAANVRAGRLTIPEAVSLLGGGKSAPQLKLRLLQEIQAPSGGGAGPDASLPARLTPAGQTAISQIEPVMGQMQDLIQRFEPYKGNNTPLHFFGERLKYAFGKNPSTGEGDIANEIANLELAKITGAMPYATRSRNFQYIQQIQQHLPNVWRDSPSLIYSKLTTALENMKRIHADILQNDSKGGFIGGGGGAGAGGGAPEIPGPPAPPGYTGGGGAGGGDQGWTTLPSGVRVRLKAGQ